MNKKLAKKYLDIVAEDYINPQTGQPHVCRAKKKCPLTQCEFDFGDNSSKKSADYIKYLADFKEWAFKQRNPAVLTEAMNKYGANNDDMAEIIAEASKELFKLKAEEYMTELGERL